MLKQDLLKALLTIALSTLFTAVVIYAWQAPSAPPPAGNVPAPLNVGPDGQAKAGGLILNTGGAPIGLIVDQGNVGIGTTSPGNKLHVVGSTANVVMIDSTGHNDLLGFYRNGQRKAVIGAQTTAGGNGFFIYHDPSGSFPLFVNASGNVGIGTLTPEYKLDVAGGIKPQSGIFFNGAFDPRGEVQGGNFLSFGHPGVSEDQIYYRDNTFFFRDSPGGGDIADPNVVIMGNVGIGTTGPTAKLDIKGKLYVDPNSFGGTPAISLAVGDTDTGLNSAGDGALDIYSNNVNTMSIRSGNVGIGTTNPTAKLEVAGQIKITGGSPGAGKVLTSDASGLASWQTPTGGLPPGTSGQTLRHDGTSWVANSVIYNNGTNVGIGTTAPNAKLDVKGKLYVDPNSFGGTPTISLAVGDTDTGLNSAGDGALDIYSNNVNTMSIRSGNVGIGTTGPSYKLDVAGGIRPQSGIFFNGAFGPRGEVQGGNFLSFGHPGVSEDQIYYRDNTFFFRDSPGGGDIADPNVVIMGNVGIGTTAPSYKLDVASGGGTTARFGTDSGDKIVVGGGAGKIDAGTMDPVYEIDGEKYATYVPDFAGGVRIETSGTLNLECEENLCKYLIDFKKLEKGSNLWLFWKASNKNVRDFAVLLTPSFDGKVWYEKREESIIIYSEKSGEVSFRLSAPRIDFEKWENLAEDQNLEGIKVDDY